MSRAEKKNQVATSCDLAVTRIDEALAGAARTSLSPRDLVNIRAEVLEMKNALDPRTYKPSFGRFVSDSYEGGDELTDLLLNLSYEYSQRLK